MMICSLGWADDSASVASGQKQPQGILKAGDCKRIHDSAATFLAVAGKLLEGTGKLKDSAKPEEGSKKFQSALDFSELASNFSNNYQAYYKL
jgi:hypothetical protein